MFDEFIKRIGGVRSLSGGCALSSIEINLIETKWNFRFPNDYKEFAMQYAGCGLGTGNNYVTYRIRDSLMGSISFFYGGGKKQFRLDRAIDMYRLRLPLYWVPIATDVFGNQVCIYVGNKHAPAIAFWDHEQEDPSADKTRTETGVQKIGGSFTTWLTSFQVSQ